MKTARLTVLLVLIVQAAFGQKAMELSQIIEAIDSANPVSKMFDAQIRAMDEAAKGARSWMPAEFGTGLWMTPYNPAMWKKGENGATGMGQYMLSVQQMFPNKKKQNAESAYMQAMSSSEKERKKNELIQLYAEAKKNYYDWMIVKKKLSAVAENERLLNFMIKDAEIRYKNGLDKLSAYYKAKAALGSILNTKVELQNEGNQKRIRLNTLMNRNTAVAFDIDTNYRIKNYTPSPLDTAALQNRSDVRAIDKDITLAALQQAAERAKVKPEFGLRYDHMFGFGGLPMQYSLMAMAKIPLGKASRMPKANAESLRWKAEALEQQKRMLLNEAAGAAAELMAGIESKQQQVKLFEENILPALRKNYQVMQLGYQQNTEQLFSLFDAWDTLSKTQTEYLGQLQQLLDMQAELERILQNGSL